MGQAFRSERPFGGGPESEADAVPPRPGLPVGDWISPLACRLGIWAGAGVVRRLQRCLLGRAFVGKPVYEGPRVYKPDTRILNFHGVLKEVAILPTAYRKY